MESKKPKVPQREHMMRLRIVKLGEDGSNVQYWATRTISQRLAYLEELRQEVIKHQYGTEPGFQRVCRIAQRSSS